MAQEYIHSESIGNLGECMRVKREHYEFFHELYKNQSVKGFQQLIARDAEDVEDNFIFSDHRPVTNGVFPFLYLAVEPKTLDERELDSMMREKDYVKIQIQK